MPRSTLPLTDARPLLRLDPDGALRERRYQLTVVSGPDAGKSICILQKLVLGSHPSAGFLLSDPSVSRFHVELTPHANGLRVADLRSKNGTYLGTVRVEEVVVAEDAKLKVGQTLLDIRAHDTAVVATGDDPGHFGGAITRSPNLKKLFGLLERAARSDSTILLEGETGTGKDLLARAIHDASPRARGPFVVLDCGSVSEALIESDLFGHLKGAFTGAVSHRAGAFVQARQGTLFLDEVGELPLALQPKLLRALESRTIRAVGEDKEQEVDVRVIAATHRDLEAAVAAETFRRDLFFRLAVIAVAVPPLRERREDIPELVRHFVRQSGRPEMDASEEVLDLFEGYPWPGNVRELRNVVERALSGVPLEAPPGAAAANGVPGAETFHLPFKEAKRQLTDGFTRAYLEHLSGRFEGNLSRMARAAGIERHHLRDLLQRHDLYEGS